MDRDALFLSGADWLGLSRLRVPEGPATLSSPSLLQHGNVYNLNKKTPTITEANRHSIIDQYIIEKLIVQLPHRNPLIVELGLGQAPAPTFLEGNLC